MTSPYQKEFDELNIRIREINKEIDNFLNAIGKSGGRVINVLEKKIEVDDLKKFGSFVKKLKH